jgi:hypothetical protein
MRKAPSQPCICRYYYIRKYYRLIGLESGSFLRGDYKITQRWAKVFLKALVERNSVMVEVFYMILISQKYDQKPTILKG